MSQIEYRTSYLSYWHHPIRFWPYKWVIHYTNTTPVLKNQTYKKYSCSFARVCHVYRFVRYHLAAWYNNSSVILFWILQRNSTSGCYCGNKEFQSSQEIVPAWYRSDSTPTVRTACFILIFGKAWNINKDATFTWNRSIPKVFWKTKSLWSWNDVFLYGNIFIPFRNFCSFRSRRSLYVQSKLISSIAYMFVSLLSFFIFWCIFKEWFKNRILSDKVNRIYTLRNYFLNQLKVENLLLLQENLRS